MFYEAERIIHKQRKYVKMQALNVISSFANKTLTFDEVIACIDLMLQDDNNETRVDVLNLARNLVISRKETYDEDAIFTEPTTCFYGL